MSTLHVLLSVPCTYSLHLSIAFSFIILGISTSFSTFLSSFPSPTFIILLPLSLLEVAMWIQTHLLTIPLVGVVNKMATQAENEEEKITKLAHFQVNFIMNVTLSLDLLYVGSDRTF